MSEEIFIHQRENSEDTEKHLQENQDKYLADAVFLLRLMYQGKRLSDAQVMREYGCQGRRLRELFASGKCSRGWKKNENGKRMYVEYFIPEDKLKQPTKEDLQTWFTDFQNGKYDDKPPTPVISMEIHKEYHSLINKSKTYYNMICLEKYHEGHFVLPCVVDCIDYQKQLVLDIIQHKDEMFKMGQELQFNGIDVKVEKKLKDYPVQTEMNLQNRLDYRKVRYYCIKN